jgi:hypothetical protein
MMYCSPQCQTEDWKAFHRAECSFAMRDYNYNGDYNCFIAGRASIR